MAATVEIPFVAQLFSSTLLALKYFIGEFFLSIFELFTIKISLFATELYFFYSNLSRWNIINCQFGSFCDFASRLQCQMFVGKDTVSTIRNTRMRNKTEDWENGLASSARTCKRIGPQQSDCGINFFICEFGQWATAPNATNIMIRFLSFLQSNYFLIWFHHFLTSTFWKHPIPTSKSHWRKFCRSSRWANLLFAPRCGPLESKASGMLGYLSLSRIKDAVAQHSDSGHEVCPHMRSLARKQIMYILIFLMNL